MATSVGTLFVDIKVDPTQVGRSVRDGLRGVGQDIGAGEQAAASFSQRLTQLGTSMGNVGRQVSLGLSLPLIAFGKAASNAFVEFDTAMTQVVSLSGVNREVVKGWRSEVIALGSAYGITADEAAKGLYYITSSGVDAAQAMEVLDIAVKGAAIGLGSVQTNADVITSAMNQYGEANISAAAAADVLTAAVRTGKGEADEMAGALATVIPLAGSMGVQFGEVAGVMSAMTLSGTSADQAATQINALLSAFQKMPENAQRSMKALTGLDYETVKYKLRNEGLVSTLRTVYNAFGENEDAIGKVFGNIRALRGITNLFGEKEQQTLAVVDATTNAYGEQARAVAELENSEAHRLAQAQAKMSGALTSIGASVTPIVATVSDVVASTISSLDHLGGATKTAVVGLGALAAAAGPLLYVSSSAMRLAGNIGSFVEKTGAVQRLTIKIADMATSSNLLARAFGQVGVTAQAFAGALTGIAIGAAAVAIAVIAVNAQLHAADEQFKQLAETGKAGLQSKSYNELGDTIGRINTELAQTNDEIAATEEEISSEGIFGQFDIGAYKRLNALRSASGTLNEVGEAAAKTRGQAEDLAAKFGISTEAAVTWINVQKQNKREINNAEDAINLYTSAIDRHDLSVRQAYTDTEASKNTLGGLIATTKETSDAFFAVINAQKQYEAAQKAITDAKQKVTDAEKAHRDAIKGVVDAQKRVVDADRKVIESGKQLADARQAAADAQKALNDALAGPSKGEALDVREAQLNLREAQEDMTAKPGEKLTANERERRQIALERARMALTEAQAAHDKRVADARKDVESATRSVEDAERSRQDAIDAAQEARAALQVARDKEHESLLAITTAQQGVAQAQTDAVGPAMNLTSVQNDLNTMHATGTIEADKYRQYLERLKEIYPNLATELQKYIDKFNDFANAPEAQAPYEQMESAYRERFKKVLRPGAPLDRSIVEDWWRREGSKRKETGGYLRSGQLALVNERNRPELFSSGGKQYLLPLSGGEVQPVTSPSAQVPTMNVGDINVYGADQPVQTAYEVRRQLRAKRDLVGRR